MIRLLVTYLALAAGGLILFAALMYLAPRRPRRMRVVRGVRCWCVAFGSAPAAGCYCVSFEEGTK